VVEVADVARRGKWTLERERWDRCAHSAPASSWYAS
jgi:hypothetical protein